MLSPDRERQSEKRQKLQMMAKPILAKNAL